MRDLYRALEQPPGRPDLRGLLRSGLFVPGSKPADDLLEEMQTSRQQMAVVIDEFGGTAGVVTLENLVEALVGPIEDELAAGQTVPTPDLGPAEDGSLVLDGLLRLDEWEELTGLRLEAADHDAVDTVGGLVMARLSRIAEVGDVLDVDGQTLRVERLDGRRVAVVRLLPAQSPIETPR